MTRDDAARVLAVLTAAWPNQDVSRDTAQLWLSTLCELDLEDAKAAARDVVRQDHWFPSVARFLQAVEVHKHARRNREAAKRGLPTGDKPVPPNPELLAATRRLIAERKAKRHDHHGPVCPACGPLAGRPNGGVVTPNLPNPQEAP